MNPETNFPEPIRPPTPSSKRQMMLSLTAITMGLITAAFLLTRSRTHAPAPKTGCGSCSAAEAPATAVSPGVCGMYAAPSNPTDTTTHAKKSGVPHEQ